MAKTAKLKPIDATPVSFAEFGQVISASSDGQKFGPQDAQLELHRGIPRVCLGAAAAFLKAGYKAVMGSKNSHSASR